MENNNVSKPDIVKLLTLIRLNFENAYCSTSNEEKQLLVDCWFDILKPYSREIVFEATNNVLAHSSFAPHIGDIVKEVERIKTMFLKPDNELWQELMTISRQVCSDWSVANANYTLKESNGYTQSENAYRRVHEMFENLDWELKEFVGNIRTFTDICGMDGKELQIAQARFVKQLPQMRERKNTREQTSATVARLLTNSSNTPLITDGNNPVLITGTTAKNDT